MQNSILEQTKVAEYEAVYKEQARQVSCTAWKNDKFYLQQNFWSYKTETACFHHLSQPGKQAGPLPYNRIPGRPNYWRRKIVIWCLHIPTNNAEKNKYGSSKYVKI